MIIFVSYRYADANGAGYASIVIDAPPMNGDDINACTDWIQAVERTCQRDKQQIAVIAITRMDQFA